MPIVQFSDGGPTAGHSGVLRGKGSSQSSGRLIGDEGWSWPLRRLGHETGIASKGAKMASFPDLSSTAVEKVPLGAHPLCKTCRIWREAQRGGWLPAKFLSSWFILCLSSRRSPTQGTRTKKGKRGEGRGERGSTKLQLLPARPDGMELEGVGRRRRRGQLQSKRGWSSQSWPTCSGWDSITSPLTGEDSKSNR